MTAGEERSAARNYCRPECRNPDYNECADCWKDGGNPALYPTAACTCGLHNDRETACTCADRDAAKLANERVNLGEKPTP